MRYSLFVTTLTLISVSACSNLNDSHTLRSAKSNESQRVHLGPRPFALIDAMTDSPLKTKLLECANNEQQTHPFSIGHRGAPMQFPEHTKESYIAAARMGAGVLECDVTFTADNELVCRHSQCDLHTTTNILATDLAQKCSQPFSPAKDGQPAHAKCCTSDITLAEFKTLKGKMDGANTAATNIEEYLAGTPNWRTDLYAQQGSLMTHAQSIALFKSLGVQMTPELKAPEVAMPHKGMSQRQYATKMIEEYTQAGVPAHDVWPQSFNHADVVHWINAHPDLASQSVFLDGRDEFTAFDPTDAATWSPTMDELVQQGVEIIAPPIWMLLTLDDEANIVPSPYAKAAKAAGLDIITWSLERSGPIHNGGGWYYQSIAEAINNDGMIMTVLDILAQDVGVKAVFSDWPATTTYYANCVLSASVP